MVSGDPLRGSQTLSSTSTPWFEPFSSHRLLGRRPVLRADSRGGRHGSTPLRASNPWVTPPQMAPTRLWCPRQFPGHRPSQTLLRAVPGWAGARWHPWAGNLGGAGGFSLTQHNCCGSRLPAGESGHQRTAFITCYKTAISSQASSLITQPVLSFHFITGINNEFKAWKAIKMCD